MASSYASPVIRADRLPRLNTPIDVLRLTFDAWNGPRWIVGKSRVVDPLKRGDGCRIETMSSSLESLWYMYIYIFFSVFSSIRFCVPHRCVRAHRNFSISFYFFFSFPLFAHIQANTGIRWLIGGSGLVSPCLFLIARTSTPKYRNSNSEVNQALKLEFFFHCASVPCKWELHKCHYQILVVTFGWMRGGRQILVKFFSERCNLFRNGKRYSISSRSMCCNGSSRNQACRGETVVKNLARATW